MRRIGILYKFPTFVMEAVLGGDKGLVWVELADSVGIVFDPAIMSDEVFRKHDHFDGIMLYIIK